MAIQKSVHWSVWVGRVLSALVVVGLGASAAMKLSHGSEIVEAFVGHFGYSEGSLTPIAILEIACAVLYAIPKTRVLGGVFVAAYLGGATATHVRVGDAFIAPVILGIVAWVGLYLQDAGVRAVFPIRSS